MEIVEKHVVEVGDAKVKLMQSRSQMGNEAGWQG
jgi:hypothetical protein